MNSNLQFDFIVNKENNTVNVIREFAANLEVVWEAWTNPVILDQWWAPKPYWTETKSMDFREGGMWLYAMISPENEKHWCKNDYQKIEHQKYFSGLDAFCNENGAVNTDMPRTLWSNNFTENGEKTTVNIVAKYESLSDLEKIIELGFKEGFTMALENLDQYIEAKFKLRKQNKTDTENWTPIADEVKKMVLHVELPIIGGYILMGTDAPKEMGFTLASGNNMHICLEPETREEADRLFSELSVGGNITMPMADMFFGSYFGEFTDKFGVNWMINFQNRNK